MKLFFHRNLVYFSKWLLQKTFLTTLLKRDCVRLNFITLLLNKLESGQLQLMVCLADLISPLISNSFAKGNISFPKPWLLEYWASIVQSDLCNAFSRFYNRLSSSFSPFPEKLLSITLNADKAFSFQAKHCAGKYFYFMYAYLNLMKSHTAL